MELLPAFQAYIQEQGLFQKQSPLWLAVSGGVDSAVLTDLCIRSGYSVELLHVNYGLRGRDSDLDEALVKKWGADAGIPVHSVQYNLKAENESATAIQEKARNLRYQWFSERLRASGPACILTAHHADDQVETLLFRYFRGSGIRGLLGMEPRGGIIPQLRRPLLFARKKDLLAYAKARGLEWRDDASNATVAYTRNYIRHSIIPSLHTHFPQLEEVLLQRQAYWKDALGFYEEQVQLHLKKWIEKEGSVQKVPVLKIKKTSGYATLLFEWLQPYGFLPGQMPDVLSLLQAESGKYVEGKEYRIYRNRQWLLLAPVQPDAESQVWVHEENNRLDIPAVAGFQWHIKQEADPSKTTNFSVQVDAAKIQFPLLLRRWKMGDYFYPLGMPHKKKLSRFFIDQKLSIPQKENCWVLCSGEHIVWVIGQRIDHRFRITESTQSVLQLQWEPVR